MSPHYNRRDSPAAHARSGNFEPLAKHIEMGGELDGEQREILVAYLRGELQFKPGNRRTFAQQVLDTDASLAIHQSQIAGLARSEAIKMWLDSNPGISEETLKKMLKRARSDALARRQQSAGSP